MVSISFIKNIYGFSIFGTSCCYAFVVLLHLILSKNPVRKMTLYLISVFVMLSLGLASLTPFINSLYTEFSSYQWGMTVLITISLSLLLLYLIPFKTWLHKHITGIVIFFVFVMVITHFFPSVLPYGNAVILVACFFLLIYALRTVSHTFTTYKNNVFLLILFVIFDLFFLYDLSAISFPLILPSFTLSLWITPLLLLALIYYILDQRVLESQQNLAEELKHLNESYSEARESIEDVVIFLARTIDAKDKYTEGHIERVSQYAVFLGERIGLSTEELETLRVGAMVHDIGKIVVDLNILNKPGKLTDAEFEEIKLHPLVGEEICRPLKSLEEVIKIVRYHHEKLDGSGYPDGITGDDIPIEVRIVTIVDIFDALTTDRSYRKAMKMDDAIRILREDAVAGKLDHGLVEEFIDMLSDLHGYGV